MNKQKGITLIALVVTIIVLIILAGISINLILGENGIITKATNAREATRAASVEEQKNLWQISTEAEEHTGGATTQSLENLVGRLVKEGLLTEEEKDQILGNEQKGIEGTGEITIGDKTIVFMKSGLMKFTISGTTYYAEEGMTWEIWINSKYNTLISIDTLQRVSNIVWKEEDDDELSEIVIDGVRVLRTATIISGQEYTIEKFIPG